MKESTNNPKAWISFRVKPSEYEIIQRHFSKSTYRKLSEYARKVLLQQPVTIRYHNQSADDFLELMLLLKKELNAIGINYNQSLKKLHTFKTSSETVHWLLLHEQQHHQLQQKIEEIFVLASKIHQQWLSE